jgi:hypothetical protein
MKAFSRAAPWVFALLVLAGCADIGTHSYRMRPRIETRC